jgi:putative spermidine/putrescine transport system permease protein
MPLRRRFPSRRPARIVVAHHPRWLRALGLSLWIAALTALAATAIAFLTAWCARCRMPPAVSRWLDLLVLSPLFFPHAALGVALVNLLAVFGLVATPQGIVLAHLVCALPFAYRPVAVAMHRISPHDGSRKRGRMTLKV